MSISHALASSMGGIRTAGDLVARMQLARKMRLDEAKRYVAQRLGVGQADLSDEVAMRDPTNLAALETSIASLITRTAVQMSAAISTPARRASRREMFVECLHGYQEFLRTPGRSALGREDEEEQQELRGHA